MAWLQSGEGRMMIESVVLHNTRTWQTHRQPLQQVTHCVRGAKMSLCCRFRFLATFRPDISAQHSLTFLEII